MCGGYGAGGFLETVMIGLTAYELVNHVNTGFGQLIVKSSDIRITKEQITAGLDKALLNGQCSDE